MNMQQPASAAPNQIDHPPHDPQHPSDLFSPGGSSHPQERPQSQSVPPQVPSQSWPAYQNNPNYQMNPSWGGGAPGGGGGWAPQSPMIGMVPPELDPIVDTTSLDRKTASYIQQEVAKWARDTKYTITPEEGKPLLRPIRNLFFGLITGTFAGRFVLTQFAPAMVAGHKSKSWLLGTMFGGYPIGGAALYFSQVSSVKAVLDKKTPLGVQARYIFRVSQAEKNGLPRPPPPFGTPYMAQQPGMNPSWGSPYDQQQQQPQQQQPPSQPLQWNTFNPQPQYPPPTPSNIQHWGASNGGENSSREPRYRSWDDIRRSGGPADRPSDDLSPSGGSE